jgi:DNA polymerase-3 subunit beta
MKFTIKQADLKRALNTISGCLPADKKFARCTPFSNLLIESLGENSLRLIANGIDLAMRCDVPAEVAQPGSLCIDGPRLLAVAPTLPDSDVSFTKEPNLWARIEAGKSKMKIAGTDSADFPPVPFNKTPGFAIPTKDVQTIIRRTAFAATSNTSVQYILDGVKIEAVDGELRGIATDGYRVGFSASNLADVALDFLLPRRAAAEILKFTSASLTISDSKNHVFIEGGESLLVVRKLSGEFPQYRAFFAGITDLKAAFDVEEMKQAIRRCGMFASLDTVRCDLSDGVAVLRSQTADAGEIEETLSVEYAGPDVTLGFRWPHFLEFLTLADTGRGDISFAENPTIPAVLTADELTGYKHVLVLLNLHAQDNKQAVKQAA